MLDIKRIKEDPAAVKAGFHAKQVDCDESIDRILELDAQRRALIASTENKKAEQNKVSREIPQRKKAGEDVAPIFQKMGQLKAEIAENEQAIDRRRGRIPDPDAEPAEPFRTRTLPRAARRITSRCAITASPIASTSPRSIMLTSARASA